MTSEAASPVMAGASVASVHTAAADAEGVHRGAVSGRGHANFADPPLNSAQIQVDMQHMDDVMGMQMHDREGCVSEGLMASGHMREASFGGSLRTPLAQSGKLRGVPGANSSVNFSVEKLAALNPFQHKSTNYSANHHHLQLNFPGSCVLCPLSGFTCSKMHVHSYDESIHCAGDSTVEPLGASGSLIRNKIPEASDRTDDLEGDSDVHKPLLK